MRYIVSIDVGVKNCGICVFDFLSGTVIFWDNVSLASGRYVPAENVAYVRDMVSRYSSFFEDASHVLVERQMRCNMRIIEAVIQSMFFDKTIILSPHQVKAHYGLCTRNYRLNKKKAVEWAAQFIEANPGAFAHGVADGFERKKQDDLADSLLLITYYLDTYSKQVAN